MPWLISFTKWSAEMTLGPANVKKKPETAYGVRLACRHPSLACVICNMWKKCLI